MSFILIRQSMKVYKQNPYFDPNNFLTQEMESCLYDQAEEICVKFLLASLVWQLGGIQIHPLADTSWANTCLREANSASASVAISIELRARVSKISDVRWNVFAVVTPSTAIPTASLSINCCWWSTSRSLGSSNVVLIMLRLMLGLWAYRCWGWSGC